MPAAELSSIASALGVAVDFAKALVGERDRQKALAIEVDFTKQVLDVQTQLSQVLAASIHKDAAHHALAERVRELEAAQSEKARYRLAKVGSLGSLFAYELRPPAELLERADEPPHFVCQPCFDAGKKSVLNFPGIHARCSICRRTVEIHPSPPAPPLCPTVLSPDIDEGRHG